MPDPSSAIVVENLVKSYAGTTAVNNISFNVAQGEILGFLGPNGAGKSTTMRILTGFLPATSGRVEICGHSVAGAPDAVKRVIGYMPENNPLPEDMRVVEYLYYRGRLKEMNRRKLAPRIDELLELCDLKRVRHRIIGKLSKGFRQRIGIAEAILAEPPVIIMDEPTIGLDPHQILIVRDLIARLRGRMTVIISSHILPEIEMTCDRVLIINQGRVVAAGEPAALKRELFGRARYDLDLAAESADLAAVLAQIDSTLEITSETVPSPDGFKSFVLNADTDEDFSESLLTVLARDERFRLRALSRAHPTLEDVFLAATKRSWDIIDSASTKSEPLSPKS
jgi:ABC-2 type transport system ATP-binding protein